MNPKRARPGSQNFGDNIMQSDSMSDILSTEPKRRKPRRSRAVKDPFRLGFRPEELFLAKKQKNYTDENPMPRDERNRLRSIYKHMSDEKKIKYVKMAEENYDSYVHVAKNGLFTSYLNKSEIKLLWKSYCLPEPISPFLNRYICQDLALQNSNDLQKKFQEFAKMSDSERSAYFSEHESKFKKFRRDMEVFLNNLPPARLDDFKNTYGKRPMYKLNQAC